MNALESRRNTTDILAEDKHTGREVAVQGSFVATESLADVAGKVTEAVGQMDDVSIEVESERHSNGEMTTRFRFRAYRRK